MSFWISKIVKHTKKPHRCEFCGVKIPVGSSCHNEVGTYCGDFNNYYLCERCRTLLTSKQGPWDNDGDELGEFHDILFDSDMLVCPKCGKSNHREYDYSDDMLSIDLECNNCDHKYTVDLSAKALMAGDTP